ncbi:MAG: sel1 repeat family protein, partial [Planctomycetaceae bacterium]|nr:sel1 repeat family protein [Planctomycetaceae bacterium]
TIVDHIIINRRADKLGYAKSCCILGLLMKEDANQLGDLSEAFSWIEKGANLGEPSAQSELGVMYLKGFGCNKNEQKGVELIQKAADQNVSIAQYQLGTLYTEGLGVERNSKKAIFWLSCAASSGLQEANTYLRENYKF